jgi:hypothetical protein
VRKPFSNQFKHFACEMMLAEHCIFGHIQSVVYWKFQEIGICAIMCVETQSNTYHDKKKIQILGCIKYILSYQMLRKMYVYALN